MNYRHQTFSAMSQRIQRRDPEHPIVIGICAPKGSGKTAFQKEIVEFLSHQAAPLEVSICRASFAEPLKEACHRLFGIDPYLQEDKEVRRDTPAGRLSPREIWQRFGVGMRDLFGEDFWINTLYHDFRPFVGEGRTVVVVDDVRFPNEANAIRERGGLVVGLLRPKNFLAARNASHSSERLMVDHWGQMIDLEVRNDSDLDHLRECAQEVAAGAILGCAELKTKEAK